MEMVRTGIREVKFYLDRDFLFQYGLDFEIFENRKPFKARIIDDLLNMANERYGLNFGNSDTPKTINVTMNRVVMVFEKDNMVYLESEEAEVLEVMKGIREIFCFLPDEKINLGIMGIDEKRRLLEEIRNDDDMNYIREKFIEYE